MALEKIVKIIFSGDSKGAEDAAKKTSGSLDDLSGSVSKVAKGIAAFVAGSALVGFFKAAVEAANNLEASNRKLDATSKLTGVALSDLQAIAKNGTEAFKLSKTLSADFAVELAKLAGKAGDVSKAGPGMQAFLDIGAARGLDAAATLKAVQQSILGIDEGTDKLFNKNPSVLYKEYADRIGTTAGKLTDQQKAQALLTAAIEDGLKVQGAYADYLRSFPGALQSVKIGWENFKVAVGEAVLTSGDMQTTAGTLVGVLGDLEGWIRENEGAFAAAAIAASSMVGAILDTGAAIGQVFGGTFADLVKKAAIGVEGLVVSFRSVLGSVQQMAGGVVWALGEVVGVVAKETGEKMVAHGKELIKSGRATIDTALDDFWLNFDRLTSGAEEGQKKVTAATQKGADDRAAIVDEETKKRLKAIREEAEKAAKIESEARGRMLANLRKYTEEVKKEGEEGHKIYKELGEILDDAIGTGVQAAIEVTTEQIDAMAKRAHDLYANGRITKEEYGKILERVRALKGGFEDVLPKSDDIKKSAQAIAKEWEDINDKGKLKKKTLLEILEAQGDNARKALEIGDAFGLVNEKGKAVLNTVIVIGENIGKALGGDVTSMLTVVSGLANLIGNWGSSAAEKERQRAMAELTDAIERNIDALSVGTTGHTASGVFVAAGEAVKFAGRGTGAIKQTFFEKLAQMGVKKEDALDLLDQYGLLDAFNSGDQSVVAAAIQAMIDKLAGTPVKASTTFGGQVKFLEDEADLKGLSDDALLTSLANLGASQAGGVATKNVLWDALVPGVTTPEGRAQVRANLLAILDRLGPNGAGLSWEELGGLTPREIIDYIETVLPLLESATINTNSPFTGGPVPVDGPPRPPTGAPIMPEIPSGSVPFTGPGPITVGTVPPVPSLIDLGGAAPAPTVGTLITGAISIGPFNITVPEDADPEAWAETLATEIDRILEERRTQQVAATGAAAL